MESEIRLRGVGEIGGPSGPSEVPMGLPTSSGLAAARAASAPRLASSVAGPRGEVVEFSADAQGTVASRWSRTAFAGILAVGGLLAGCAVSALALGPAGLLVTVAVEAMAFAGGVLLSRAGQQDLQEMNRRLTFEASRDGLTGLRNRAAILDVLERELEQSGGRRRPLAVILADLDGLATVNDRFGNLAGDEVLREAARRVERVLRSVDAVGRSAAEDLLVVVPGAGAMAAAHMAERIRRVLADPPMPTLVGPIEVTASFGVASTEQVDTREVRVLVQAAGEALHRAKDWGRNRVVVAGPR